MLTHRDGERPLPGGGTDVDSYPAVGAEHELPHRQQARVGHVPQPHPGDLHTSHNYTRQCLLRHISKIFPAALGHCRTAGLSHRFPLSVVYGAVKEGSAACRHRDVPAGGESVDGGALQAGSLVQNVIIRV